MERRGCGVGCVFVSLGLLLGLCLLPYLISSIYSIVSTVFGISTASTWLWGDWLGTVLGSGHPLYMFLAEGPICCVGAISLLILILGVMLMITGTGSSDEHYDEYVPYAVEEYEYDTNEEGYTFDQGGDLY